MSIKIVKTTMTLPHKPALDPTTTTILVTGATGSIANHVINEALLLGYTVRGTARTEAKAASTHKIFGNNPKYSTTIISNYGAPDPAELDTAVRGVNAIIHVAGDTTFSQDAEAVIKDVVTGNEAFLEAAAREPTGSVKRFVLTSSSTAATCAIPDKRFTVTTDTWNDEAVDIALNKKGESLGPNFYGFVVYSASKTEGERAVWKFVQDRKPNFAVNTILPGFNGGKVLEGGSEGVTMAFVTRCALQGARPPLPPRKFSQLPISIETMLTLARAEYYIDVIDDARLHLIAAVLDDSVENERIFAWSETFNWNEAIDIMKKVRPDLNIDVERDPNEGQDLSKAPNELGAKLLKKWYGQDGYKSLEQSLRENLEHVQN